jgi:hypothetical protein
MGKADNLSFPTIRVWGSRTESSYQSISWRKRVEVVISLTFEVHIKKIASSKISDSSEIPMYGYGKITTA